jgi:hypothetical protein
MSGSSFLASAMINIVMSASTIVCAGLAVEANRDDFAQQQQPQQSATRLFSIIEGLFSDDLHPVVEGEHHHGVSCSSQMLHDHVHASNAPILSPGDVILLGFAVVRVATRLMTTYALPTPANVFASTFSAASPNQCCLHVERLSSSGSISNSSNPLALLFISKSTASSLHMRLTPQSLVSGSVAVEALRKSMFRVCDR